MSSRVSNFLGEILQYHKDGYQGLRFMPLDAEEKVKFLVGPRRYFSMCDGSYVSEDWRKKCVEIAISPKSPKTSKDFIWTSFKEEFENGGLRSRDDSSMPLNETFQRWLSLAKLDDVKYSVWFEGLFRVTSTFSAAVPYRELEEANSIEQSTFFVRYLDMDFDEEIAPTSDFHPPPAGSSYSNPAATKAATKPTLAQCRGIDAPKLLWDIRQGPSVDQRVDRRWDENN
ncbi:MAG: hypothetical protein EAZ11_11655 [Curvibacter sp.]|nr:MAG: hypothetical protein EAZ11_11655 [Curvibacter sp.]